MSRSSAVVDGVLRDLGYLVNASTSPQAGWNDITKWVSAHSKFEITQLPATDIEQEAKKVTEQLGAALSKRPLPEETRFLYFGLYEVADRTCGFYVSGGERAPNNSDTLKESSLTLGERVYLRSGLLDALLRKSGELSELDSWFGYALSWGAAAILAKYSARALGLSHELLVGFDSGDVQRVK